MCGISASWVFQKLPPNKDFFFTKYSLLFPRGPDSQAQQGFNGSEGFAGIMGFARLVIQGTLSGSEQPFTFERGSCMVNGEIYNSKKLGAPLGQSDCFVVKQMLEAGMPMEQVCRQLDGDFAIVFIEACGAVSLARDPYGVKPLFYATYEDSETETITHAVASELKGLYGLGQMTSVVAVTPGTVMRITAQGITKQVYHQVPWLKNPLFKTALIARSATFIALKAAVKKRLVCNPSVNIGVCLSGGLDSSVVATLANDLVSNLRTYSIGMEGSCDLAAARKVADFLRTEHHEILVTEAQMLDAIPEVIRAIESYDITTVRASVGNYLVGKYIAQNTPTVKVVLNGDGADELFGGYLYMRAAPSDQAFEEETTRLLTEIHQYDVLRSERSMAAHGLEARSPFLDRHLVSVVRGIPTGMLRPGEMIPEKFILRSIMSLGLPLDIVMRPKEAFSDGVSGGRSWYQVTGEEAQRRGMTEAEWYLAEFRRHYGALEEKTIPGYWMPRFIAGATDPSARTLQLYGNKKCE
jgi:asparagine synthase (glutamine-hydrolysing)